MKKEHNPKTHSAKKGSTWHFSFKAHIGIDEETRLVHNVKITSANENNIKTSIYKKLSRNGQYAANEKKKHLSVTKLNMFSQSLNDYLDIEKHDTVVCENRLLKIILIPQLNLESVFRRTHENNVRACVHMEDVRIFEHNFAEYKAKNRRNT